MNTPPELNLLPFTDLPMGSRFAERHLDNGARLVAIEVPTARQVRLVAAIGAGALDEPTTHLGLAHLLEHSLFLGSDCHPHPGDFAAWVGAQGGRYNAHTDEAVTDIHLTLPPDTAEAGLERLLDIVVRPQLARNNIAHEINVIEAEFQARLADPALHRQAALSRLYLPAHPAHHNHHGCRRSLGANLDELHKALVHFHASHYRANRLSLVMLGPQPLERQLEQMTTAACSIAGGAERPAERCWRWARPARIQWCLPPGCTAGKPTLELLWPLPVTLTAMQRLAHEQLARALGNGELTTTLQHHAAITELTASLVPDASPSALSLSLTLTPTGQRQVETVLATCQTHLQHLARRLTTVPSPPLASDITQHDLDTWPITLARRLAVSQSALRPPTTEESNIEAIEQLVAWLDSESCRVLEQSPRSTMMNDLVPETRTPFLHYPPSDNTCMSWPLRTPPFVAQRKLLDDDVSPAPGLIEDNDSLVLWWGGGPPAPDAFYGLAWPAPVSGQSERLTLWQQSTLPLRQTIAPRLVMTLGYDVHSDWLWVRGEASRLESCLSQALSGWLSCTSTECAGTDPEAPTASGGLIAQRLLTCLETQPPPVQATDSRILAWVGGTFGAAEALASCQRLMAHLSKASPVPSSKASPPCPLPACGNIATGPTRWLTPQGDDRTLMLQVDAPDDSPTSQALFQMLAQCHDAAFQRELRQRRGLGYVAAVRYREAHGWPRLGYVVQSPHADITTLRDAVCDFLNAHCQALAQLDGTRFAARRASLLAQCGPPEVHSEALSRTWQALRRRKGHLAAWETQRQALADLTPGKLAATAEALVTGALPALWWAHSPSFPGVTDGI
ncbi:insulinase family protein [Halomonas huangheensis]|uniref:Uncharacterized protein n=1 Tax=Halomonas huangheensis TaxID=1178482 RepID=W1N2P8_9GAMM|nr:insulinase family protein [Halomonas huangheensis]ALM51381.1 hypothetical protein AR456_03020 [Halomonas huangheensis]ERL49822.1 hypothetical protein BJB45_01495 [Halomonas huangheensis]